MRTKYLLLFIALSLIPFAALNAENLKDRLTISFDTYSDNVNSVVLSPGIGIYKKLSEKFLLGAKMRVDAITAATKTYGGRAKTVDAVTGATPTRTFDEVRAAPSLTGLYTDGDNTASFGGYYSAEKDYIGRAVFVNYTRQLNEQNTALGVGLSRSFDKWKPFFKRDLPDYSRDEIKADLSVTQLLSPTLSVQATYSYMYSSGFLSSPYHYLISDTFAVFERYPDNRTGNAIALRLVKLMDEQTSVNFAYRFYRDSWGINSHTLNAELYRDITGDLTLGGRFRYYTQDKANFAKGLADYTLNSRNVAVDYRMSAFDSSTIGLSAIYKPEWKDFALIDVSRLKIKASADYYRTSDNNYIKYWYDKNRLEAVFTSLSFDYEF